MPCHAACVRQATRETFVDGFMQTGDVFEQRGPSNIVWIDRKSNIMKLSQACAAHPSSPACRASWQHQPGALAEMAAQSLSQKSCAVFRHGMACQPHIAVQLGVLLCRASLSACPGLRRTSPARPP